MISAQKFNLFVSGMTSAFVSTAFVNSAYIPSAQAFSPTFKSNPESLVYNGDFEIDTLADPKDPTFTNPNVTGWTKTGPIASDKLGTRISNSAQSGHQSLEFMGFQDLTFISQYVPTIAGKAYELSYYLNVYSEPNALDNQFQAFIGGKKVFDKINLLYQNYTKYDFNFLATSASTEIKFGTKANYASFNLDTVVVEPGNLYARSVSVPEPFTLGGTAIAGLVGIWLKKKRAASTAARNS